VILKTGDYNSSNHFVIARNNSILKKFAQDGSRGEMAGRDLAEIDGPNRSDSMDLSQVHHQ
jgi:hypothetical protein